ncbi:MAG: GIY-YIG nuclease family protein [Flavobacteriaceae bacterium]|nr:GIY-YIG nuclease family protein [Flavobacteriaceae bacterium]
MNQIHARTDVPKRTDLEKDYREKKFVYVISNPAFPNMFKVGIAKDWKAHLKSYQIGDLLRGYKKEFVLETPQFRETEKHIHEQFDNLLEWYQGDLLDIIQAIKDFNKESK